MKRRTHIFALAVAAAMTAFGAFPAAAAEVGNAPQAEESAAAAESAAGVAAQEAEGLVPALELQREESEAVSAAAFVKAGGGVREPSVRRDNAKDPAAAEKTLPTDWGALSALRRELIDYAKRFEGESYTFGGNSPETGFDCSGFIQYVMKQAAGLSLTHQSASQAQAGSAVSASEMRPGDIIAYDGTPSNGVVNHVAIYAGDGKAIHAVGSGKGVQITAWDYAPPMAIRNVIGD